MKSNYARNLSLEPLSQEEDTDVSQLSRKLESVLSRMSLASLVAGNTVASFFVEWFRGRH